MSAPKPIKKLRRSLSVLSQVIKAVRQARKLEAQAARQVDRSPVDRSPVSSKPAKAPAAKPVFHQRHGVDSASSLSGVAYKLKSESIEFVGRYLTGNFAITSYEARELHKAGLSILLYFEQAATRAQGGRPAGVVDATIASKAAHQLGVPKHTLLVAAVDFEVTNATASAVHGYIEGFRDVVKSYGYIPGVYGGLRTIDIASNAGIANLVQTIAWSDGKWDSRAQIRQTAVNVPEYGGVDRLMQVAPLTHGATLWVP